MRVLPGTLSMLVLKSIQDSSCGLNAAAIAEKIRDSSGGKLYVRLGSLKPALLRLEDAGSLEAFWLRTGNRNQQLMCYRLAPNGRSRVCSEIRRWKRTADATNRVVGLQQIPD